MKKIGAICDKLTLLYLELAGIKTAVKVNNREEAIKQVNNVINSDEYGIVIISSQIYDQITDEITEIREQKQLPLVVKIPEVGQG